MNGLPLENPNSTVPAEDRGNSKIIPFKKNILMIKGKCFLNVFENNVFLKVFT